MSYMVSPGCLSMQVEAKHSTATMLTHLRARSRSLFPSYKPGGRPQAVKEYVDVSNTCVKPWSSMQVRQRIFFFPMIESSSALL